ESAQAHHARQRGSAHPEGPEGAAPAQGVSALSRSQQLAPAARSVATHGAGGPDRLRQASAGARLPARRHRRDSGRPARRRASVPHAAHRPAARSAGAAGIGGTRAVANALRCTGPGGNCEAIGGNRGAIGGKRSVAHRSVANVQGSKTALSSSCHPVCAGSRVRIVKSLRVGLLWAIAVTCAATSATMVAADTPTAAGASAAGTPVTPGAGLPAVAPGAPRAGVAAVL